MDHYVIHIYGLVIHTWNALTLWAFSVFSGIKRLVKSFVGFFQCIAKITNLSYSYHTTITADHTWNEKLKLATYDQVEQKILWKSSTKYVSIELLQYDNKECFLTRSVKNSHQLVNIFVSDFTTSNGTQSFFQICTCRN